MKALNSEIANVVERIVDVFDPHRLYGTTAVELGPVSANLGEDGRRRRRTEDLTAIPISSTYMEWRVRCENYRKNPPTHLIGGERVFLSADWLKSLGTVTEAAKSSHLRNASGELLLDGEGRAIQTTLVYEKPEQHPDSDVLKFYFFENAEEMIGVLREFARLLQENRRIRPDSQAYEFLAEIKALVAQITSPTILEVAEDLNPRDPLEWVDFARRRSIEHWPEREMKRWFELHYELRSLGTRLPTKLDEASENVPATKLERQGEKETGYPSEEGVIRKQGQSYLIDQGCLIEGLEGMTVIYHLLEKPNQRFTYEEIERALNPGAVSSAINLGADAIMDKPYKKDVSARLEEICKDLETAIKNNDLAAKARLDEEKNKFFKSWPPPRDCTRQSSRVVPGRLLTAAGLESRISICYSHEPY